MADPYERSEEVGVTGDEDAGDLWAYIIDALGYRAKNEPVPQGVADKAHDAACILAAATLHQGGLSMDACERLFVEREYAVKMNYDRDDDSFGIEIEWEDGTKVSASNGSEA